MLMQHQTKRILKMGMTKTSPAVNLGAKKDVKETPTDEKKKPAAKPASVEDHSEDAGEDAATQTAARQTPSSEASDKETLPARVTSSAVATRGGQDLISAPTHEPDGFEDLDDEIGFGSFPILTLSNGTFNIGDEDIGKNVDVILQQSRRKHLYKEGGVEDTDYVVYSYDEVHDMGGKPLDAIFDEWAEAGVDRSKIEHKKYSEAVGLIISDSHKGELVLLSVPPASIKRFAGYRSELKVIRKAQPQQVVTRLVVGPVIKASNGKKFNPWQFKFVRRVTDADLAIAFEGTEEGGEAEEE
jgi:hypothetical protein